MQRAVTFFSEQVCGECLSSFEPTQGTGAATLGIFSNGENGAYEKGDGCTDQTKLTLTGYRRESFVIDRVVTSGKEGLDTHHIVPIRCVKHATNDRSLTSVSSWVMYNSSKVFDRNRN